MASQPELIVDREYPQQVSAELVTDDGLIGMFERLATNKDVDVAKLEKLIEMQERILAHNAKAAYTSAFVAMQNDLPVIDEKGVITNKSGGVQSKYAKYEDIQKAVKPILQQHGFVLNHRTSFGERGVKVIGVLAHREGHSEETEFESKADESGAKNGIQGLGSALSYGMRYTTLTLLNIITAGLDDDGASTSKTSEQPAAPAGYQEWLNDMTSVADNGLQPFRDAWMQSQKPFRDYVTKHEPLSLAKLRTKAEAAAPKAGAK